MSEMRDNPVSPVWITDYTDYADYRIADVNVVGENPRCYGLDFRCEVVDAQTNSLLCYKDVHLFF